MAKQPTTPTRLSIKDLTAQIKALQARIAAMEYEVYHLKRDQVRVTNYPRG